MSQSDYILYKKMHREMDEYAKTPTKISRVLDAGKYISYKEYAFVNTIVSHKERYDKYVAPNIPIVFGMEKRCAEDTTVLPFCKNTHERGNRIIPDPNKEVVFRQLALKDVDKATRMKWKPVFSTNMCKKSCDDSYGKW